MDTDMALDIVVNMEEVQVMHSPDMDSIPMVRVPVDMDLVDRANKGGILDKEELEQLMVVSTLTMEDTVVLDMEELIKELIKELPLVHLEVVLQTCKILDLEMEDLPIMDSGGQKFLLQGIILIKMVLINIDFRVKDKAIMVKEPLNQTTDKVEIQIEDV